jgi:hypothetical protein
MPVNETGATTYLKVEYEVKPNISHSFRLYIQDDITYVPEGDSYFTVENPDTSLGWTVAEVVKEFIGRWYATHTSIVPQLKVTQVEIWQSFVGNNTFIGYDGGDYDPYDTTEGGSTIYSAYHTYVFQTGDRNSWNVSLYDVKSSVPFRRSIASVPVEDDGSLAWFVLKSSVPFVNNDGDTLTLAVSHNGGYNNKLARDYGRDLN